MSVVSTAMIGGIYLLATALSGFWLGSIVDHNKQKLVLQGANICTLVMFSVGLALYSITPVDVFSNIASPLLWLLVFVLMVGVIAGNVIGIAVPTLVRVLVPEDSHDKANGLFGTVMGVSFAITSVASGVTLAFAGMFWVLVKAVVLTLVAIATLQLIQFKEKKILHTEYTAKEGRVDNAGTIKAIRAIPGLFPLIFFTTFNNF